jgi:hypothetical protein
MKSRIIALSCLVFVISSVALHGQPIPVELMVGNKFTSLDVTFTKPFKENSKFGFFHMNTIQADYDDKSKNSFVLQDLVFFEAVKNLKIVAGAFYGKPGFNTTAGLQYSINSKKVFFLFAPRVNIIEEPSYDFMTIFQYKTPLNEKVKLYTRLKLLNVFDANEHIRSYQWFRLGVDLSGTQFGLALDLDEYGPDPSVEYNFGFFVRREIF